MGKFELFVLRAPKRERERERERKSESARAMKATLEDLDESTLF